MPEWPLVDVSVLIASGAWLLAWAAAILATR